VIKRALELSATALILVHNHFSGEPTQMQANAENVRYWGLSGPRGRVPKDLAPLDRRFCYCWALALDGDHIFLSCRVRSTPLYYRRCSGDNAREVFRPMSPIRVSGEHPLPSGTPWARSPFVASQTLRSGTPWERSPFVASQTLRSTTAITATLATTLMTVGRSQGTPTNSTPNPNASEPDDVLIVRPDEQFAHAHQEIARADEQLSRVTNSTPNPNPTEPDDVLVARPDEQFAHAYEQIALADEQLARVTEQLSELEHESAHHSPVPGRHPSRGRPVLRGLVGLLLAACVFVAAFVSQSSYGDVAKLVIARWAPQVVLTSSRPVKKPELPVQPSPSAAQVVAAESVSRQPTPSAQTAPQEFAPTAAPLSPELAQMLQTMARDLANVEQGIEQLKTSQEQMTRDGTKAIEQLKASQEQIARDNAKAIEQLKASQEKMASLMAKASEHNLKPKTSAPPPRPIAPPTPHPIAPPTR
jgi:RadC-like JAB domain